MKTLPLSNIIKDTLGVLTLLVLAFDTGEKHCLAFISRSELDSSIAHFFTATLGTPSLYHRTFFSLLFFRNLKIPKIGTQ